MTDDAPLTLRKLPKPDVPRPAVAWPTVGLAVVSIGVWVAVATLVVSGAVPTALAIVINTACSFALFTVLHDSAHRGLGRLRVANEVLGRLAAPFVTLYASFPMFRHIHLTHHRFVNEGPDVDPDDWMAHGPVWQLPLRWMIVDLHYLRWYLPRASRRPRAERLESLLVPGLTFGVIAALTAAGFGGAFLVAFLIPQRLALIVLAWWFDYLPHHNLEGTNRHNRTRSTRNIIGLEWLLTPLMFGQNYHLVHHLHPIIPFYRYVSAWRQNEEAYLTHDPALSTISGRPVSPEEYRAIRGLAETT
ncbi:fatty acid desaturase [Euzebya tangerina]|uniref:fatty acid desaturase n=1 Tax=Euzebya tangerina TaxID=591198 RepID=UPI000E31235B|nr:fatty acid desaturase [Euzebya tangerina]